MKAIGFGKISIEKVSSATKNLEVLSVDQQLGKIDASILDD